MQAVDLVRKIYAAHAAGDGDSVRNLCADDITFDWAADSQHAKYAGPGQGKAAFLERLAALGNDFEYQSLELVDIIAAENRVAAQIVLRMTRRSTGRAFVIRAADFWTVRDGMVVDYVEYYDTALAAAVLS